LIAANKTLVRRHFDEVLNQGQLEVIDELYAETYVLDAPVQTDVSVQAHNHTVGRDGLKRRVILFRTAFPDLTFTLENLIAEGEFVVAQYRFCGTHLGDFRELAPTGKRIDVGGMLIAHVREGRIQSVYSVFDSGDLLRQLCPDPEISAGQR